MCLLIYAELSSSGIGLPDSHYEMDGIPLYSSMIALVLLAFSHKFTKYHIAFILLFIFLLCFFQDLSDQFWLFKVFTFLLLTSF